MQEQFNPAAQLRQLKRDLKTMANALQRALDKIVALKDELKSVKQENRSLKRKLAKFEKALAVETVSEQEANEEI